ncbi:RluA family pseudouridine synthase [Acutalibacter caecimuris]|uniref:RluA family pseudouridine synthase n=1 Tax=Acutalibacter caecimuris TaxID=3093657 RepID=UPI002AC903C2|nr:RluA family pseudouridine synthase [Acutalibacter sp. M00118]
MPRKTIEISPNDAGQRLDRFLAKAYPNLPNAVLHKCIRTKDVRLNGSRCLPESRLRSGDVLSLYWQEEYFRQVPKAYDFLKAPARLSIVYEDGNLMLLDKPPGLIVHPGDEYHFDSLIARIQHYLYDKGEYRPDAAHSFAPALVNRIDRNTGGIVMAAKNAETLRILNQKVKGRELRKLYLCVVCGQMGQKQGLLTGYLTKNEAQNRVYFSKSPAPGAKSVRTGYQVLEERGGCSLLQVELFTGRTHQIRAHMAAIGHPLAGDGKYGRNAQNRRLGFPYQALYSHRLEFRFTTPAGALDYLNGRCFQAGDVWFLQHFRQLGPEEGGR